MENKNSINQTINNMHILGTPQPRKSRIIPDLAEQLNKYYSNPKNQKKNNKKSAPEQKAPTSKGSLISTDDYWIITGVEYRNEIYVVDLLKTLLDKGNAKVQDEWAEYSLNARQNNEFYTGDMPLYHAVFTALFTQKDKPEFKQTAEQARDFIKESMRDRGLSTLTKIAYQPKGNDKVIHNYNMPNEYTLEEEIVGKDGKIISADKKALTALLGNDNLDEIKKVYNWINQTPTCVWRLNSKPKNIKERVARFNANSNRANLNCDRNPDNRNASLGVKIRREAPRF